MALPGIRNEKEIKLLLTKLLENKDELFKFALVATGPKEGELILSKREKLKRKEVQTEAEAEAKEKNGGKAVKMDVMTGECRLDDKNKATLRLIVFGKAPAKAVSCVEHLLVRGPFKTVGFTGVILEEVEEVAGDASASASTTAPGPKVTAPGAVDPNAAAAAQKTKLAEALKQLKPTIDKVIEADPERKTGLYATMAQIAAEIKSDKLDDAKSHIVALGKSVQSLLAQKGTAAPAATAQLHERFEAAKARIEPQLHEAQRANPDKRNVLLNLWNHAIDQGDAENFTSANAALDKLETAIATLKANAAGVEPSQEGGPARAAALEDWAAARAAAVEQLNRLSDALEATDDTEADALLVLLEAIIKNLTERPTTIQQVTELVTYLETDKIMLDAEAANPFGFTVSVRAPLLMALTELAKHVA